MNCCACVESQSQSGKRAGADLSTRESRPTRGLFSERDVCVSASLTKMRVAFSRSARYEQLTSNMLVSSGHRHPHRTAESLTPRRIERLTATQPARMRHGHRKLVSPARRSHPPPRRRAKRGSTCFRSLCTRGSAPRLRAVLPQRTMQRTSCDRQASGRPFLSLFPASPKLKLAADALALLVRLHQSAGT